MFLLQDAAQFFSCSRAVPFLALSTRSSSMILWVVCSRTISQQGQVVFKDDNEKNGLALNARVGRHITSGLSQKRLWMRQAFSITALGWGTGNTFSPATRSKQWSHTPVICFKWVLEHGRAWVLSCKWVLLRLQALAHFVVHATAETRLKCYRLW